MNVMLMAHYPGTQTKEVIRFFLSPELPARPDFVKELGSMGYADTKGYHTVFLFEVPDDKIAEFHAAQRARIYYLGSRVEGLTFDLHLGVSVAQGVPEIMPHLPA